MSDWQPIGTAPVPTSDDGWENWTDAVWVLVYDPDYGVRSAAASPYLEYPNGTHAGAVVNRFEWWTGESYDSDLLHPTHWMPLPDPPSPEAA